MKKLIVIVLILATSIGYSQDRDRTVKQQPKTEMTPQDKAEKKTQKMKTDLNLTEAQVNRVREINMRKASDKRSDSDLSKEEKDAYKREMRAVLNDNQYRQWERSKMRKKVE